MGRCVTTARNVLTAVMRTERATLPLKQTKRGWVGLKLSILGVHRVL